MYNLQKGISKKKVKAAITIKINLKTQSIEKERQREYTG